MDADELLDYALGRLGASRRDRLERRMSRDPALAERVRRLVRNLGRLLDDGRGGGPPAPDATGSAPVGDAAPVEPEAGIGGDRRCEP